MSGAGTLDGIRNIVKALMRRVAQGLNHLSRGRLKPSTITMVGLLAHIPIAVLIGAQNLLPAAILLIIFGLFDALDGELARLQHRESNAGMLLDATTDRMKEILLYIGVAYYFVAIGQAGWAVWAVAACGASILVSYVKAKGETAVAGKRLSANEVNRLFQDGLMRYEVRMAVLVIALLANKLSLAVVVIAITAWWTAMNRLVTIMNKLES